MKKFAFNKLIRDKIPEQAEKTGCTLHIKPLSDTEYNTALINKLCEEVDEVKSATGKKDLTQEIADVYEVMDAFCALHDIHHADIQQCKQEKLSSKGGFYHRTYVTVAEYPPHSAGETYCLNNPDKYPEIKD